MGHGGKRPGAGRKRKTLLELVNDGTWYASKAKHRELLRTDHTLLQRAELEPGLSELAQLQLAYRELGQTNPWYASTLAHRFHRLVRERAERLIPKARAKPRVVTKPTALPP
jgi:hypothetical protein